MMLMKRSSLLATIIGLVLINLIMATSVHSQFPQPWDMISTVPYYLAAPIIPTVTGTEITFVRPADVDSLPYHDGMTMREWIHYLNARGTRYMSFTEAYYLDCQYLPDSVFAWYPELLTEGRMINLDGNPVPYGDYGDDNWVFCEATPAWHNFLLRAVLLAIDAGAEVMVYDTPQGLERCFCPYDIQGFRDYLKNKYTPEELAALGITDIDNFDYGQYLRDAGWTASSLNSACNSGQTSDIPLWDSEWIPYQEFQLRQHWASLVDSARVYAQQRYGRDIHFAFNLSGWGGAIWKLARWSSFTWIEIFYDDMIYPQRELTIPLVKVCEAAGRPLNPMTSPTEPFSTSDLGRLQIAELYSNGGIGGPGISSHPQNQLMIPYFQLVQFHPELFDAQPDGEMAVLYALASARHDISAEIAFNGAGYLLSDLHRTFDALFAGDGDWMDDELTVNKMSRYCTVFIPNQAYLTETQAAVILDYIAQGGMVLSTGQVALYDPDGNPGSWSTLQSLLGGGYQTYGSGKVYAWTQSFCLDYAAKRGVEEPEAENIRNTVAAVLDTLVPPWIATDFPRTVIFERRNNPGTNSLIYHLINFNYDPGTKQVIPEQNHQLTVPILETQSADSLAVTLYSPDDYAGHILASPTQMLGRRLLYKRATSNTITMEVPELKIWAIIKIEPGKPLQRPQAKLQLADELDKVHVINHQPVFRWSYSDPNGLSQVAYQTQVGTSYLWADSTLLWDSGVVISDTTSTTYAGLDTLADGTSFIARVRVQNSAGSWSEWAQLGFRMNTPPTVPQYLNPAGGILTTDYPEFNFFKCSDVEDHVDSLSYNIAIYADSNLTQLIYDKRGIRKPVGDYDWVVWTADTLLPDNLEIYWHARSFDGYEFSPWSPVVHFYRNFRNDPPYPPILLHPKDGAPTTLHPSFTWENGGDPDGAVDVCYYNIYYSDDSTFTTYYSADSLGEGGLWWNAPEELENHKPHYWRIQAFDHGGLSTFSETRVFYPIIDNAPPGQPAILAPDLGEKIAPTDSLRWLTVTDPDPYDVVTYTVEIADSAAFDSVLVKHQGIKGGTVAIVDINDWERLGDNTIYFWRVKATDNIGGESPFSPGMHWFFFNRINDAPKISDLPDTISLAGDSTVTLYLDDCVHDPDDPDSLLRWSISETQHVEIRLDSPTRYLTITAPGNWWGQETVVLHVQDPAGATAQDTITLVVIPPSSINHIQNSNTPTSYCLFQNYPNPFNPCTTILYGLPESCRVVLKVFSITGQEVGVLVDEYQEAGWHQVKWDARAVGAGIYFCRLSTSKFSATIKVILLR